MIIFYDFDVEESVKSHDELIKALAAKYKYRFEAVYDKTDLTALRRMVQELSQVIVRLQRKQSRGFDLKLGSTGTVVILSTKDDLNRADLIQMSGRGERRQGEGKSILVIQGSDGDIESEFDKIVFRKSLIPSDICDWLRFIYRILPQMDQEMILKLKNCVVNNAWKKQKQVFYKENKQTCEEIQSLFKTWFDNKQIKM